MCSSSKFSAEEYFKTAINLAKQYDPLQMFRQKDIKLNGSTYHPAKILWAIKEKALYDPDIYCRDYHRSGNKHSDTAQFPFPPSKNAILGDSF
ncbi:hypothetical protein L6164_017675 [Bauhinia variegata]|uniref:Uncharacterized protein n=1 Tax=Bauhinia variegata TaxID=167791 RepID=A0ACB9NAN4_BAUVA|nr:hypothetical protein L6164_017675 [Bauhinia variegata]